MIVTSVAKSPTSSYVSDTSPAAVTWWICIRPSGERCSCDVLYLAVGDEVEGFHDLVWAWERHDYWVGTECCISRHHWRHVVHHELRVLTTQHRPAVASVSLSVCLWQGIFVAAEHWLQSGVQVDHNKPQSMDDIPPLNRAWSRHVTHF